MKKHIITIAALAFALSLQAQNIITRDQVNDSNIKKMAGSVYQYEDPTWEITPAPKGFKPIYLTHFARHGSRYLEGASKYERPIEYLREADEVGKLTPFGKDILDRLVIIREEAITRMGDLSQKGMAQHRGMARRMVENYPELFTSDKTVVARSTTSHRVLVSEYSALMQIVRMRPDVKVDYDSSNHDEPYMYTEDKAVSAAKRKISPAVQEFNKRHTHPEALMSRLFTDTSFITNYNGKDQSASLNSALYEIASSVQGVNPGVDLNDLFTYDEWYDLFLMNNMRWYSTGSFSPLSDGIVAYGHCATLQNFIDCADASIAGNGVSVNLRFGHDVTLMSFFSLLDLNQSGYSTDDLETVADHWASYNLAHMGGNVQWIFYRDKKGEVILRFLMNEEEATLPESVPFYKDAKGKEMRPFYRWEDVRKFYLAKIEYWEAYKASHPMEPEPPVPARPGAGR